MRELILVADDSDASSLVFRAADNEAADNSTGTHNDADIDVEYNNTFFLQVTDEVRDALKTLMGGATTTLDSAGASATITDLDSARTSSAQATAASDSADTTAGDAPEDSHNDDASAPGDSAPSDSAPDAAAASAASTTDDATAAAGENTDSASDSAANTTSNATAATQGTQSASSSDDAPAEKTSSPSLTAPLTLRPREIQARIRGGQSIAEVAADAGVAESRIEPFAHPVLIERARIADMGKMSHPVREDGPTPLTLFEVVATAFTARGIDMTTATWDAYRDAANQWVVALTWKAGLSENTAEWSYHGRGQSPETTVARNALAADLIDPDFARPVRTISRVGRGGSRPGDELIARTGPAWPDLDDARRDDNALERTRDDTPVVPEDSDRDTTDDSASDSPESLLEGEALLKHPEPGPKKPAKRKAVTPHWEDVLLGVRGSTKRPRK